MQSIRLKVRGGAMELGGDNTNLLIQVGHKDDAAASLGLERHAESGSTKRTWVGHSKACHGHTA